MIDKKTIASSIETTSGSAWYSIYDDISSKITINDSISINDDELKERITKKINEILDEDTTIEIMKNYLLDFIDKNIDNPENLIKDALVKKDEELDKCKKEIEQLKMEINNLKILIPSIYLSPYSPTTTPCYPPYPTVYSSSDSSSDSSYVIN
jgi:hypothetical protein